MTTACRRHLARVLCNIFTQRCHVSSTVRTLTAAAPSPCPVGVNRRLCSSSARRAQRVVSALASSLQFSRRPRARQARAARASRGDRSRSAMEIPGRVAEFSREEFVSSRFDDDDGDVSHQRSRRRTTAERVSDNCTYSTAVRWRGDVDASNEDCAPIVRQDGEALARPRPRDRVCRRTQAAPPLNGGLRLLQLPVLFNRCRDVRAETPGSSCSCCSRRTPSSAAGTRLRRSHVMDDRRASRLFAVSWRAQ
jgi:hypothetical protein